MSTPARTPMRRCGKRWATETAAQRSKAAQRSGSTVVPCPCGGFHVRPALTLVLPLPTKPRKPLKPRSDKTARKYVTRRSIVAELFAEPSVCEVPWCADKATDPHEPLTRARGGDILDRANIRKVCHPHNVMFASAEEPWMYRLGFLKHSGLCCRDRDVCARYEPAGDAA